MAPNFQPSIRNSACPPDPAVEPRPRGCKTTSPDNSPAGERQCECNLLLRQPARPRPARDCPRASGRSVASGSGPGRGVHHPPARGRGLPDASSSAGQAGQGGAVPPCRRGRSRPARLLRGGRVRPRADHRHDRQRPVRGPLLLRHRQTGRLDRGLEFRRLDPRPQGRRRRGHARIHAPLRAPAGRGGRHPLAGHQDPRLPARPRAGFRAKARRRPDRLRNG